MVVWPTVISLGMLKLRRVKRAILSEITIPFRILIILTSKMRESLKSSLLIQQPIKKLFPIYYRKVTKRNGSLGFNDHYCLILDIYSPFILNL
jgi:hypothetical protein